MFYKKTSTNYKKWDCFESSEEEEDTDPVLPKNDPAFKAMEADINDRKKRRQRDYKEATVFKEKGNDVIKKGLYKSAIKYYSDGIELRKDYLVLYTNRALAYNKIEKYQESFDDCFKVLEYCEIFDDGYDKQKDLCFKALLRRCVALRGLKDYELALKDLE